VQRVSGGSRRRGAQRRERGSSGRRGSNGSGGVESREAAPASHLTKHVLLLKVALSLLLL
jgi:hypothetical protein